MTLHLVATDLYAPARTTDLSADVRADLPADARLLVPTTSAVLQAKVVDDSLAALWHDLATPRPATTLCDPEGRVDPAVLALVFDGVFGVVDLDVDGDHAMEETAIEVGPAAAALLDPYDPGTPSSPGAAASWRLVDLATRLPADLSVDDLTVHLYRGGAHPRRPEGDRSVQALPAAVVHAARRGWTTPTPDRAADSGWWMWWPRRGHPDTSMKLYVGVHPDDVVEALPRVVGVLASHGAPAFKFAHGDGALTRADKLVVYVDSPATAAAIGAALDRALHGVRRHLVPFALQLDPDGLVFVGSDPGAVDDDLGVPTTSWRLETCAEVARGLAIARHFDLPPDQRRTAALHRAAVLGIDPTTWAPPSWPTRHPVATAA